MDEDMDHSDPDSDIDETTNKLQRLILESNSENPFDLRTPFGRYASIHTVLKYFSDRTKLQRLVSGPDRDMYNDTNEFDRLTQQWHQEIGAMIDKRHSIAFEPTNES
jgi:hypothetical protein